MEAAPAQETTVLIVEDQTAIREMLTTYISALPGFRVVGNAGTAAAAQPLLEHFQPNVVVLDWMLQNGSGLEVLRMLQPPKPKVLIFSAVTNHLAVRQAFAHGALGYVEKYAAFEEFAAALRTVAQGKVFVGPAVASAVGRIVSRVEEAAAGLELSPRECDILRLVAEGLSSKEIATTLGISVRTVENHRANITRRTGLGGVAQLTLHAVSLGLVDVKPAVAKN